ncbi:MAG TPA: c-type cytochrome domain-containing protein [Bacteroidota bacterium]
MSKNLQLGMALLTLTAIVSAAAQDRTKDTARAYTYVNDVAPIINAYCIRCHGSNNENPSEYVMEDYESIVRGGNHGATIVRGQPDSSMFYYKLLPEPPFGKQMPRGHKKIAPELVRVIHDWIAQGVRKE